jgi:7-alpha-hydroxysteroid dehydrogenase
VILDAFRLTDRVAVVTGGGRGIGRGVALAFADAGADVVVAARRAEVIEEVAVAVRARGRRALAVPTDVTDLAQIDRLVGRALEAFGHVDVLVNNAGGSPPTIALALDDADFEAAYHFNVTSALHASRLVAPHMARDGYGSIVNVSSAMSHLVDSGFVAYAAAKAALNHMTRLLAHEWAPHVRVNAVAAGATLTDALEPFLEGSGDLRAQMEAMTPMARLGTTEDIAAAVLYLASPAASWVTGKVLEVDGGTIASNWPFKVPGGLGE